MSGISFIKPTTRCTEEQNLLSCSPETSSAPLSNDVSTLTNLMDKWIWRTKPNQTQSRFIYKLFLRCSRIHGSELFTWHLEKTLKIASESATGYTLLKRLVSCTQQINFKFGKINKFKPPGEIVLAYPTNYTFQLVKTETHLRELRIVPDVAILIHELLHCWHFFSNPAEFYSRIATTSHVSHMDDQEEELTILGTIIDSPTPQTHWNHAIRSLFRHTVPQEIRYDYPDDPCCEMMMLRELNQEICGSHRGITVPRKTLSLQEMITFRAVSNVIAFFKTRQPILSTHSFDPLSTTLAHKALALNPKKINDYHQIATILMKNGVHSSSALKLAILTHDTEIILQLRRHLSWIPSDLHALAKDRSPPLPEIERYLNPVMHPKISARKREIISFILFSKFFGKTKAPAHLLTIQRPFQHRTVVTKPPIAKRNPVINMINTGVSY